jgi:hypothetical protein
MHVSNNTAAMDQFAFAEYTHYGSKIDPAKDAKGTQFARLVMSRTTYGPPLVADPQPFYGSEFDLTEMNRQPVGSKDHRADNYISSNLTFASLPLTFLGRDVKVVLSQDLDKGYDEPDIQRDIEFIARLDGNPVAWRWYEEGYDREPTDSGATASHDGYVSHHEAPQYFGYLANNPALRGNFRGLGDFFVARGTFSPRGKTSRSPAILGHCSHGIFSDRCR